MKVTVLGSGSKGNCTLVESLETAILIDGGLSCRQMEIRIRECAVSPSCIKGVVITHEHGDHVKGLPAFCAKHGVEVYSTEATAVALSDKLNSRFINVFKAGIQFRIGDLALMALGVPHDAADPVCIFVRNEDACLGYLTDLGYVNETVMAMLVGCTGVVIESNYDEQMLQKAIESGMERPWGTHNRNSGRGGHLSNRETAEVLRKASKLGILKQVRLAHLSRTFNDPYLAYNTVKSLLPDHVQIAVASQDLVTAPMEL